MGRGWAKTLITVRWVCVLLLALMPVLGYGEVYQWKDAQGRVHFGDRPPADAEAEALDVPHKASPPTPAVDAQERRQRQQRLIKVLEEKRLKKAEEKQKAKEQQEKLAAYCKRLKIRIKDSERINRFYRYDEAGERQYMSDEQADRLRQSLKDKYQARCTDF